MGVVALAAQEWLAGEGPDADQMTVASTEPPVQATPPEQTESSPTSTTSEGATSTPPSDSRSTPAAVQPIREIKLRTAGASATSTALDSVDAGGEPVTYQATKTIDGDPTTTWRTPGSGIGERLRVELSDEALVTRVGLIPGYSKVDPVDGTDRFYQNRVVDAVRWTFGEDETHVMQEFEPVPDLQLEEVPAVSTSSVTVEIIATSPHGGRDFTAISEIVVVGQPDRIPESEDSQFVHAFPLDPPTTGSYSAGGHSYPATDIFAPTGTRFVAVTSGVVEEVARERSLGSR